MARNYPGFSLQKTVMIKPMRYLYLHGLASGPNSGKGRYFTAQLNTLGLELVSPDLNLPNFRTMTLSSQLARIHETLGDDPQPVTLLGSSMGGLLAVLSAIVDPRVCRLFLMAPAFNFLQDWPTRMGALELWRDKGYLEMAHYAYNKVMALDYAMIEDARHYNEHSLVRALPILIVHGLEDEVVDAQVSVAFAKQRPYVQVTLLHSDHRLTDVQGQMWNLFSHWAGLH